MKQKLLLFLSLLMCILPSIGWASDVQKKIVVKVGFDQNYPPYSYIDEEGEPAGFNIEIMNRIASLNNLDIEYIPVDAGDLLDELMHGNVDLVLGMNYSASSSEILDFTQSFFNMSTVLLVPKNEKHIYNLSDLKDKVVSVQRDSPESDLIQNIRHVKMNVASSQPKALKMFFLGRADVFIGDYWLVEYFLNKDKLKNNYDIKFSFIQPRESAFAVRKGNFELLSIVNHGIDQLKQGHDYMNIYNRWFDTYKTILWQKLAGILGILMSLAILVIVLIYMINNRLKYEVKKQTQNLSNHLTFQRQVLDTVDNGIISFDRNGLIKLINYRSLAILELSSDPVGTHLSQYVQLEEIKKVIESSSYETGTEGEFVLYKDAEEKIIHYYAAALTNESGQQEGWIVSLQDRTQQSNLQKKLVLQEKLRSLGQLVAGIAHEFRNPLTSIKMFIELLPYKIGDSRYRTELIKHVPAELKRLNNLVDDLLDYTRRKEPLKEWVNLFEFVSSILKTFETFTSGDILFHVILDPDTVIYFDKQRMKQVFINLITNAIDAVRVSNSKTITIRTSSEDSFIYIHIIDTGIGIPASEIPYLFQPFYTTKGQGVGLGLYICYNIMLEHEGDIDVHSTLGMGTTFTLKFPGGDF